MGPNRAERRTTSQRLRGLLFDDLWRKFAALGLAIGLWAYLNAQLTDKDEITLTPEFAPIAAVGAHLAGNELTIGLDLDQYGVEAITTGDGKPLESITLTLHGPRRLVGFLQTASGFRAQPEIVEADDSVAATITAEDVVVEEPRLAGLRIELVPPEIHLELVRNTTKAIPLDASRVRRTPPSGSASSGSFYERLDWSRMTFPEHQSVQVTGPEQHVLEIAQNAGEILRVPRNVSPPAPDASSMRVELEPLFAPPPRGWTGLRISGECIADIPLRIDEVEFTLSDVPVILHASKELAGRYQLRRTTEELRIAATGRLQARLLTLDDERRRAWVQENCVIVAAVPPEATGPDVISRPHVIVGPDYREGRDYKITLPLTIQYVDKPEVDSETDAQKEDG